MKAFKRALLAACLAAPLALGACATSGVDFANLTPAQQVYVLKADFKTELDTLATYRAQPVCDTSHVVGCYDREVYVQLVAAAEKADMALDAAEATVAQGGDGQAAAVSEARLALDELINKMIAAQVAKEAQ